MGKDKRASIFDLFKKDIEYYLHLGLSIRCIFLLLKDKIEKEKIFDGTISYQGVRRYILANFSKFFKKT